jgi:glutathione S-transferase
MKLYNAMLSPFAGRCRMQIYAKGLQVEFVEAYGQVSKEELAVMNPMGKIPVLEDGDLILPESGAICEYLEERFPEPPMLPADSAERARVRMLCRMADFYVFDSLAPLFAHLSRKHRDQAVVDRQLAAIERGLTAVEHFIAADGYASGPTLGLADCTLAPILVFLTSYITFFGIDDVLQPYPRLAAYWQRVQEDETAARVIAEIRAAMKAKAGG